jgi:hypothetical protein
MCQLPTTRRESRFLPSCHFNCNDSAIFSPREFRRNFQPAKRLPQLAPIYSPRSLESHRNGELIQPLSSRLNDANIGSENSSAIRSGSPRRDYFTTSTQTLVKKSGVRHAGTSSIPRRSSITITHQALNKTKLAALARYHKSTAANHLRQNTKLRKRGKFSAKSGRFTGRSRPSRCPASRRWRGRRR